MAKSSLASMSTVVGELPVASRTRSWFQNSAQSGIGEEQPIEPMHLVGSSISDTVTIHRFGDTMLESLSDAEGNMYELRDGAGRDLIGDDYLGLTVFRSDGELLAFGDQKGSSSPHSTRTIGVRDLTTGQWLWSETLDEYLVDLWFVDDRLVVATASEDPTIGGALVPGVDNLVVVAAETGQRLTETEPPMDLVFIG